MSEIVKSNPDSLSYYIQTENKYGDPVNIPVIDVRDGIGERILATTMLNSSNSSKFMTYNRYNFSPKKLK